MVKKVYLCFFLTAWNLIEEIYPLQDTEPLRFMSLFFLLHNF